MHPELQWPRRAIHSVYLSLCPELYSSPHCVNSFFWVYSEGEAKYISIIHIPFCLEEPTDSPSGTSTDGSSDSEIAPIIGGVVGGLLGGTLLVFILAVTAVAIVRKRRV